MLEESVLPYLAAPVSPLLELFGDSFRLSAALEPSLILLVEAPTLIVSDFRSQLSDSGYFMQYQN